MVLLGELTSFQMDGGTCAPSAAHAATAPASPSHAENNLTLKQQELNLQSLLFLQLKGPHTYTELVYSFTLQQN